MTTSILLGKVTTRTLTLKEETMLPSSSPMAKAIKSLRLERGLSPDQFANALGIRVVNVVVALEGGLAKPTNQAYRALKKFERIRKA